MAFPASAFTVQRDFDQDPGAIYYSGKEGFMRVRLKDRGALHEGSLALTGPDAFSFFSVDQPSLCFGVSGGYQMEARIMCMPHGPGAPKRGSLVWGETSLSFIAGTAEILYPVNFEGLDAEDVRMTQSFSVKQWGIWLLDGEGQAISPDPLFVVNAG